MKKDHFAAMIIGVAATTFIVFSITSRQHPLTSAAVESLDGALKNQPSKIFQYCLQDDLNHGLTYQKFKQIWKYYKLDSLANLKSSRSIETELFNNPPTQATADITLVLDSGVKYDWCASMWNINERPFSNVLGDTLRQSWLLRFATEHPKEYQARNYDLGKIFCDSIVRDRPFLESLGLKGAVWGTGPFVTWARASEIYSR